MFERFLGSKLDHDDPQVRAKAYAADSLDQSVLSDGLGKENNAEVLSVIVARIDDVAAVLNVTSGSSEPTVIEVARRRLVELAESDNTAKDSVWEKAFTQAQHQSWPELGKLVLLLHETNASEPLCLGALASMRDSAGTFAKTLAHLISTSSSTAVRQKVAALLPLDDDAESIARALQDKDKMAYRELRSRLDVQAEHQAQHSAAEELLEKCRQLKQQSILAQQEIIARAQAKLNAVSDGVLKVSSTIPEDSIISRLNSALADLKANFEEKLTHARNHVERRRQVLAKLEQVANELPAESVDTAALANEWKSIEDHTDFDQRKYTSLASASAKVEQMQHDLEDRQSKAKKLLESWEASTNNAVSEANLDSMEKNWRAVFDVQFDDAEQLNQRFQNALQKSRDDLEKRLKKRGKNTRKLNSLVQEFVVAMEAGDLKLAISLHDRIRVRLNEHDIEPDAKVAAEGVLKVHMPKLEEYRQWRHFGTEQARETLMGEANRLSLDPPKSPKKLADAIKKLRDDWRQLDRDDGRASEEVWKKFSQLCKEAYKPAKAHFNELSKERTANEVKRRAVIKALGSLYAETDWDSPDWKEVTQTYREQSREWSKIGVVDFRKRKELDKSYQKACKLLDGKFDPVRDDELRRRRLLIKTLDEKIKAEDVPAAVSFAKDAQKKWRPSVQADRATEQSLWNEFRTLCDQVFATLKEKHQADKEAWQKVLDKRKELSSELDKMLRGEDGNDSASINKQKARANEIAAEWSRRSDIPRPILSKHESDYRKIKKAFDQRVKKLQRQAESQLATLIYDGAMEAQKFESTLIAGERLDAAALDAMDKRFTAFASAGGAAGKSLLKRAAAIRAVCEGDEEQRAAMCSAASAAAAQLESVCLQAELIADLPSPPECGQDRMQLKMERLKSAMQGGQADPRKELQELVEQWYRLGAVPRDEWAALEPRVSAIHAALIK